MSEKDISDSLDKRKLHSGDLANISPSRIFAQARKEISQFRRDPITVGLAFLLPLIALFLYGYATRLEIKDMPVAVINFDNGKYSRAYIDTLFATNQIIPIKSPSSDPYKLLDSGKARAAIVIPTDFSRNLRNGNHTSVQAVIDATDVNNARVIRGIIIGAGQSFLQKEGLISLETLLNPEIRLWFNPGRQEALYIVPGTIALVLWIFPSLLSAIALVREKEQGTILQLYASSMSSIEMIAGKLLAYTAVGILEAIIVMTASLIFFGVWFKSNPIGFMVNALLFISSAVNFGLLAGAIASTQNSAVQIVATFGFTTTLLLSGFIYPIRNIVYPLSLISNIVPARYFIESCRDSLVRGPEPFSHWYIPLALIIANIILFSASTRKMSAMQLRG